jgi:integrase
MTSVKLKYVNAFIDRHGRPRAYFRHHGKAWPLPMPEGSPAFMAAYNGCLTRIAEPPDPIVSPGAAFLKGSIGWVIGQYLGHRQFLSKKPGTQYGYRIKLDNIRQRIGGAPLRDLTPNNIRALRDKIAEGHGTSTADQTITLLRVIWDFAGEHLRLDLPANPARGIKRVHEGGEWQPWDADVIEKFLATAKPHMQLALAVLLYTGQRSGDVIRMKWADYDGARIRVVQEKTTRPGTRQDGRHQKVDPLWIPVHPRLQAMLRDAPRICDHIVTSGWRRPYGAQAAFSRAIDDVLTLIGATEFTAHGLRKNAAAALAEAGCTDREIAAITGHKSLQMVAHYAKGARRAVEAENAMRKRVKADKVA